MADKITVTSKNSYGSRVKDSFSKILWWFLLVFGSIVLLARNEHNFIEEKKALIEWAELVQEADCTEINPELDKKEVHVVWETFSDADALKDETFGISVNDLKLARTVQMYQREEESHEECSDNMWWSETCETTYTYSKVWSDSAIDSSNFYQSQWHTNPTAWKYESENWTKKPILVWKFTLDDNFVDYLDDFETIKLSEENINVNGWKLNGNSIYFWEDVDNPNIWDLKITFSSVKTWTVSIVGMQYEDTLTSYTTSNNRSIALLENGKVPAETMFEHTQNANKIMSWIIRFFWLFLMFTWFKMILGFLDTLMKFLPFLANIVWVWTGLISLALTIVLWFLTIWISWLVVRPLIWIWCLIVAAGWIFLLIKYRKSKKVWNSEKPQKISKWWDDYEIVESPKSDNKKDNNDKDVEVIEC